MTTYEDLFRKEMDCFLKEYRDKLATNVRNGLSINSWKDVRDTLLFDFPKLRECYIAHGREQDVPRDEQSEKAKLGRMLAGAMASIRKDMWDVHPVTVVNNLSLSVTKAIEDGGGQPCTRPIAAAQAAHVARMRGIDVATLAKEQDYERNWIRQTPIRNIVERCRPDLTNHPMVLELVALKPGQQMGFIYPNMDLAKEDQRRIAYFAEMLGWYKTIPDRRRPYATKIEKDGITFQCTLTIQRLDTDKPLPISKHRG